MDEHTVQTPMLSTSSRSSDSWVILGRRLPRGEIVFFCQMIILFTVILTCIINLSLGRESEMWLILLSTSLGAVLPNPDLKRVTKVRTNTLA